MGHRACDGTRPEPTAVTRVTPHGWGPEETEGSHLPVSTRGTGRSWGMRTPDLGQCPAGPALQNPRPTKRFTTSGAVISKNGSHVHSFFLSAHTDDPRHLRGQVSDRP